ncbi:MAG: hypothetical protein J7K98_00865 [Candidatus Aenigmarchaeota archaeon]|nr:hypothetical protein [Candidatus Aenigmarchaeota archaeon]
MKKGSALIVAVFLIVMGLSVEFFFVRNLIFKHETYKRIGMEQEYIHALNKVEVFKRFLPLIVNYSWCETHDLNGFKEKMDLYTNMYGIKVKYEKVSQTNDVLNIKLTLSYKGSFFELEDVVEKSVKVSC